MNSSESFRVEPMTPDSTKPRDPRLGICTAISAARKRPFADAAQDEP
jgi:hypothetical protein